MMRYHFIQFVVFIGTVALGASFPFLFAKSNDVDQFKNSIFKITVVQQHADFEYPWKQPSASSIVGTGFYIGNGKILTNAHVVRSGRFITVSREGVSLPQPAKVKFVAHDCDLAVIEVENANYFKGVVPMSFGKLPQLRSQVTVLGYPIGGSQLSITQGIVSRIEHSEYNSRFSHLIVQTDAAINSGNSGGPVLQSGKVVGVAFAGLNNAQSIGYMIPTPLIQRVLKDAEDGVYDGSVEMGISFKKFLLSNPSIRKYYNLSQNQGGVLIHHIDEHSALYPFLHKEDILLSIDQFSIGEDGLVNFNEGRVDFRTLFDLKQLGEEVRLGVLRKGKEQTIVVKIKKESVHHHDKPLHVFRAKYVMFAGLLFVPLSRNYLEDYLNGDSNDKRIKYVFKFAPFMSEFVMAEEIVVLSKNFSSENQIDSELTTPKIVKSVGDTKVNSLAHFTKLVLQEKAEDILIWFYGETAPVVLHRETLREDTERIAKQYGIEPSMFLETTTSEDAVLMNSLKVKV